MSFLDVDAISNLKSLQEKTGKNLLGDLIKLYVETTPAAIEKMKELLESQSYEDLSREAHSLKSSSANLGLISLRDFCKDIEYKTMQGEFTVEELTQLIKEIEKSFPEAVEALESL